MKLRNLKICDAELMLEWMHDFELCANLRADFASKKISDCIKFIESAENNPQFAHFAIANDDDTYMGTVSLKNISFGERFAEFGIVVRRCAMGEGYSAFGMCEMIKYGFEKLGLKNIYWCVSRHNVRACKFYDKHRYGKVVENKIPSSIKEKYADVANLVWYEVRRDDFI